MANGHRLWNIKSETSGKSVPVDSERSQYLIRKLDQLLAKTHAKPLPERVHQIRTTARRLEALLQTLYPRQNNQQKKLRKRLRRLRRGAGGVRDVDVQIVALRKLNIGRENERRARLMQALNDLRALREQKLGDELRAKNARKVRKALQRWGAELAPAVWRGSSTREPGSETRATTSIGEATEAPATAGVAVPQTPVHVDPWAKLDPLATALRRFARVSRQMRALTPDNLHGYRTECKRIRYVAEMSVDDKANHVVDLLKRIQDAVGDWHDWLTLTGTAESQFARSLDSALISALRNVTNAKFMEARGVALEARKALLAEYRAMLARKRAERTPQPSDGGGGKRVTRVRRPKRAARAHTVPRRSPKAAAATAQQSGAA
jgi:CHAD domain-containing protein